MIKIKPISTFEIADFLEAKRPLKNDLVDSISIDTREDFDGKVCFFAINGENFNGEDFINKAIEKGAKCIVASRKMAGEVSLIEVLDSKLALLRLASASLSNTKVIGVTGSVGKTTVKEMIHSVLSQRFKVLSTPENNNNEIGVAKTLLSLSDEDFCVVEMGMRGSGEIDVLSKACKPFISVITNVGSAHIGRLGSEENIFKAKCEILRYTNKYAIVPSEKRFKTLNYRHIVPLFMGNGGDIELLDTRFSKTGIAGIIKDNANSKTITIEIPSIFLHDAQNAMIAYSVGKLSGLTDEEIKNGISVFENCKNRGKIIFIGKYTIIDDCYNASLESTLEAIRSLVLYSKSNGKTPCLLMGDMLELGEYAYDYHCKIGEFAREFGVEKLFCYGKFAKSVCKGFGMDAEASSINKLKENILKSLEESDVLLVKASRNAHFEKIIEDLKESINEA